MILVLAKVLRRVEPGAVWAFLRCYSTPLASLEGVEPRNPHFQRERGMACSQEGKGACSGSGRQFLLLFQELCGSGSDL